MRVKSRKQAAMAATRNAAYRQTHTIYRAASRAMDVARVASYRRYVTLACCLATGHNVEIKSAGVTTGTYKVLVRLHGRTNATTEKRWCNTELRAPATRLAARADVYGTPREGEDVLVSFPSATYRRYTRKIVQARAMWCFA